MYILGAERKEISNGDTKYEIVKFVNSDVELDVNISPKEETVWLPLD
jgi:hypothetical protein